MNKSDFIRMMEGTHPAGRQMTGEINELIGLFPYFHSAHILLLKTLQDSSDIRFESQLRSSAIHIADREVLYHKLRREPPVAEEPVREEPVHEEPVHEEPVHEEPVHKEPVHEEPVHEEPVTSMASDEEINTVPAEEERLTASIDDESMAVEDEEAGEIPEGDSQQTVIETARNSEDFISGFERESGEEGIKEVTSTEDMKFSRPILISTEIYDGEEDWDSGIFIIEDESAPQEEKIIYMDPGFSVAEQFDLLELESDEQEPVEKEASAAETEIPEEQHKHFKRQIHTELIDRFILANPRIEPSKERSDQTPEDISRPFTEVQGGFVTETLARIYINQGYYSRAIEIYEKLSLKFPEKSDYFAAQIEKVKDLIK